MNNIFKLRLFIKYQKFLITKHQKTNPFCINHVRQFATIKNYKAETLPKSNLQTNIDRRDKDNLTTTKARLLYQSRKRGMLENGLLLSTFAHKYLTSLSPQLTQQYDQLINGPSDDWDIYYWLTGKQSVPKEYDNEIMVMLKKHVKNESREQRFAQPDLIHQ